MGHHSWSLDWTPLVTFKKGLKSLMASPFGNFNLFLKVTCGVQFPLITRDDPINYIVIYSRNFHQVSWLTLCLKKTRKIAMCQMKDQNKVKKNSWNSDGFLTLIISRTIWLTCRIPINGILKIHWLESNASNSNQWYT